MKFAKDNFFIRENVGSKAKKLKSSDKKDQHYTNYSDSMSAKVYFRVEVLVPASGQKSTHFSYFPILPSPNHYCWLNIDLSNIIQN